jgi:hypothetical protein
MNFPVNVLPSESVVFIRLPRRKDFVNSNDDFFRRRSLFPTTDADAFSDGGGVNVDDSS